MRPSIPSTPAAIIVYLVAESSQTDDLGGAAAVWQLVPLYPALHEVQVHTPLVPPTVPPLMQ